jgi:hypothetical protein
MSRAIEAVARKRSDVVVLPESQLYDTILGSYFSGLERALRPACFMTPSSVTDVVDIIEAIRPFSNRLKVAVCGPVSRRHRALRMLIVESRSIYAT